MTAQRKPTYAQIKSRYEILRENALKIAYEDLNSVMSNKQGAAVLRNDIRLDALTLNSQIELKKWEQTGLRRVAWDWEAVRKKYSTHPKTF